MSAAIQPEDVLKFWLDETGPEGWYTPSDGLDEEIRNRFASSLEAAQKSELGMWLTYPNGALAYIILTDQFPRNMFRNDGQAFRSDRMALCAAKTAISKDWDLKVHEPARQFFYMPLMHSENLCDQERCIRLMKERLPQTGAGNLLHARAHREVIRQFGRFPYRNEALQRKNTPSEQSYVSAGGYGQTVQQLQAAG
ncbi:DUF924 domain-containing protein [Lentibacter algarum]|uniref:DUF924 family protein n=1 Tax=Lentibacter algarum TaxID=576131 RepID=UPI001C0979B1|nr:DUF924 family protein [Lentibacter algarum]MBU2982547.1 DUF924 domain-containing protein [Lentibacter algarum]